MSDAHPDESDKFPLIPPPAEPSELEDLGKIELLIPWLIVFPRTREHIDLAKKLATAKKGQLLPLTDNEMTLILDFRVWPPRTA